MSARDDRAKAVVALTNQLVDTGVAPLKASELWRLLDAVDDPSTLLGRSASELAVDLEDVGLDADRLARLLDTGVALAVQLSALSDRGIWTLTPFDDAYPAPLRARLGHRAPGVLYGAGEPTLLTRHESGAAGIGVIGSRAVDESASLVARDVGRALAELEITVVSGGSVGVDQLALAAALEAGGTTVAVLADSLDAAIASASTRRAVLDGRSCLCTPYRPDLAHHPVRAQGRNKIIDALSLGLLVVAVERDADSTWSGATEAISNGSTVAVWRGPDEGADHEALEAEGAVAVTDLEELLELFEVEPKHAPDVG